MGNLTIHIIKRAVPGSRLSDGDGLRLDIDAKGRGAWNLRYTSPISGKERLMAIGPLRDVGLSQARDLAAEARSLIRARVDPLDAKKQEREAATAAARKAITFKDYAEKYIASHEAAWRNENHRRNWRNSLRDHALPEIGHMAIADIDTDAVLRVLQPIWTAKHETARNVRQRMEVILAAAKVERLREGENPAIWRGHLDHLLPRIKRTKQHFAALPYNELPAFWRLLAADMSDAAALLRFTIATAARYSESAEVDHAEIDHDRKLWTIPASRMKGHREHTVPLNDVALAALQSSRTTSGLIFPGSRSGRKMSDVALAKLIKRHTDTPATTHGFRSCFRDWVGDCTEFPREIAEAALAHAVGSEVEQAYRRGTALEKRRALMDEWARYCVSTYN
ncbi:integrase arm-type DNA-binding domain-containing protein [Bradyrhizobium sp. 26S5]|uniref:tyrosine-type recombinase/integrase n=1 Tax=Bradyrhizobium sp. 26S5 TaxID=3139729 RepID=UPI0030D0C95E